MAGVFRNKNVNKFKILGVGARDQTDGEVFGNSVQSMTGGADVNGIYTPDNTDGSQKNMTILHYACEIKNYQLVKTLVKHGAKFNVFDNQDKSPLMYAIEKVEYLTGNYEPEEKLMFYSTDVKLICYLLKHKADINWTTPYYGMNIFNCSIRYPEFLWKMLVRHVAKEMAYSRPVNRILIKTIQKQQDSETGLYYSSYFSRCECELQELKNQIFPSGRYLTFFNTVLTFFDLLVDGKWSLNRYTENRRLVADFYKVDFASSYEIYGEEIEQRFTKVINNKEALKYPQILLSAWMGYRFDPDNLVIRKIIGYLSKKELRELCKNFKTEIMLLTGSRPL